MADTALLVACLSAGVAFAALAVWLTAQRGNTISEILGSQGANTQALKVEVANKFTIATTLPIVALYFVAAVVAVGLPAYSRYVAYQHYEVWRITGHVESPSALQPVYVTMHPPHLPIDRDGTFDDEIPVRVDGDGNRVFPSITFVPNSKEYDPVVIHLHDAPLSHGQSISGHAVNISGAINLAKQRNSTVALRV